MMTLDQIFRIAVIELENLPKSEVTPGRVEACCRNYLTTLAPSLLGEIDSLKRRVQDHYGVMAFGGSLLEAAGHVEWLTQERIQSINWSRWDAYRDHALDLAPAVKNEINKDMTRVLSRLQDPNREGAWASKGLVMGSVQSGKTANFIGLMAKAMDAGYRVVIVLTGIHESLRSQTQKRINDGILGYAPVIKSGRIERNDKVKSRLPKSNIPPFSLTTAETDFKAEVANIGLQQLLRQEVPLVFVVKKCAPILRNLYSWLSANAEETEDGRKLLPDCPMLMIDDEADQASVDVEVDFDEDGNQIGDPKTINALTRGLCHLFAKSAYVAFTATPFANILIHHEIESGQFAVRTASEDRQYIAKSQELERKRSEGVDQTVLRQLQRELDSIGLTVFLGQDLFPKDFIYSLNPPENYFGPEELFGKDSIDPDLEPPRPMLPIVNTLRDVGNPQHPNECDFCPPKHDKHYQPQNLPDSLQTAILTFMLSSALRNIRDGAHGKRVNSMLIHVSRFTDVQTRVKALVSSFVEEVRIAISTQPDPTKSPIGVQLNKLYSGLGDNDGFVEVAAQVGRQLGASSPVGTVEPFEAAYSEIRRIFLTQTRFDVLEVHGKATDALIYDGKTDYSVIVVGGNKLSRGLTLDGLLVSYYLRKSDMYDTLLQMGRWFGYRADYVDLLRIFTTDGLIRRFRHLAVAISMLRAEFEILSMTPGATPKDFGLKILAHSEMTVTSLLKLRHGTTKQTSFVGETIETTTFGKADRDHNHKVVVELASHSAKYYERNIQAGGATAKCAGVPWEVAERFVKTFRFSVGDCTERFKPMADYIRKMALTKGELENWNIYFRSNRATTGDYADLAAKISLSSLPAPILSRLHHPFVRELQHEDRGGPTLNIKATGGSSDESLDLSDEEMRRADEIAARWEKAKREKNRRDNGEEIEAPMPATPPRAYREARNPKVGRILIYPLVFRLKGRDRPKGEKGEKTSLYSQDVYWGARISFPGSSNAVTVSFVVNQVYLNELDQENEALE